MSILDKAKETSALINQKAKEKTHQAKEMIDEVKASRKADALCEELGRIVYRQHTERGLPSDDAEVTRLIAEIKDLEQSGAHVFGETDKD
jgi:uncharacterized protein Yka (UPF0111/DUF47 family)